MKLLVNEHHIDWPAGWPVPKVGEEIVLADGQIWKIIGIRFFPPTAIVGGHGQPLITEPFVRAIVEKPAEWYPQTEAEENADVRPA